MKPFVPDLTASSSYSFSIHYEHKDLPSTNKHRFPWKAAKRKNKRGRRQMISQGSLHLFLLKPNRLHSYPKKALLIFIRARGRLPEKVLDIFPGAPGDRGASLLFIYRQWRGIHDSDPESFYDAPWVGQVGKSHVSGHNRALQDAKESGCTCQALPQLWFQPLSLYTPWAAMVQRTMSFWTQT